MPTSPFDLASIIARLRQSGLGGIFSSPGSSQPNSQSAPGTSGPPPQFPGVDVFGRLIGPGGQLLDQPSEEDRLITLSNGAGYKPPDTVIGDDGLIQSNPMASAFKARKEAGEETRRQAQSEETDALVDELSRQKARKDALQDQEWAERSAQSAANFDADMQARGAQRTTPRRAGTQRIGRTVRSRPGA